jgi:hypothetical protein
VTVSSDILQDGYAGKLTTLRNLQLICGFGALEAAHYCGVAPETYRRWRNDRKPSIAAVRLLAVRAGYMPWPDWSGWEVHGGLLFAPGTRRHGVSAGQILALPYQHALISELKHEVRAARVGSGEIRLEARAV